MSFVGTRPEAMKYVERYKSEYMATLLLPAGITSEASIRYKNEAELDFIWGYENAEIPPAKPEKFEEMKCLAEKLSEGISLR